MWRRCVGWAAYCLDDDALTFDTRERAFRLYHRRGDNQRAARVAAWLAADWLEFRGEQAVANGWMRRAHRLLHGAEPGPGHGWLAVHEASMIVDEDTQTARRLAAEAVEIGRRFGVPELEMVGLGLEGVALVSEGDLAAGMQRLDEATAAALSDDAEILVCVAWACCYLIAACEQVRDYDRAGEWCERVSEFCERHAIALPLGVCRANHAGVLTWQGRWTDAEAELELAVEGLAVSRPALVGDALVRLGELRRRQGLLDEAEELFARCPGKPLAVLGQAEIALARGDPADAADLADRYLRRYPDHNRIERCAGLEVAVRAFIDLDDAQRADGARAELDELARCAGTRPLEAAALAARGLVGAARGEFDAARCALEDALDLMAMTGAPFETARLRLDLARVLAALRHEDRARREIEAALPVFRRLDARGEQARAETMLAALATVPRDPSGPPVNALNQLSKREREVLGLLADGLTNRGIAERLVVSEHTVHRHVTSILRKTGCPSRAAAASLAARHGLA
jgi:LuxR family transcriptional regulator, maltose regulon positive regulatory protein